MPDPIRIPSVAALKDFVGKPMGPCEWVTVSQERIDAFAAATGDHQWIHTDPDRARAQSPFGGTIAHGYLTLALAPPLMDQLFLVEGCSMAVNSGIERMKLQEPVPAGARLRVTMEITNVRMLPNGGARTTIHCVFEVEGGRRPACIVDAVLVYFP